MDDWPDLSEAELRATALERLDLHFEHQDALAVERGRWRLADHLRRFSALRVCAAGRTIAGEIHSVGADWVELSTAVVHLESCRTIEPAGPGAQTPRSPGTLRQVVRQMAGRVPREVVTRDGECLTGPIDWVGADFLQLRVGDRATLVPLGQVAAVLGGLDIPGGQ